MAERPSVSEILARARSGGSESGSTEPPAKPKDEAGAGSKEPGRGLSTAEKVAAIRARAGGGSKPEPKPAVEEGKSSQAGSNRELSTAEKVAAIRARAASAKDKPETARGPAEEAPEPSKTETSVPARAPAPAPVSAPSKRARWPWVMAAAGAVALGVWAVVGVSSGVPNVLTFGPPETLRPDSVDDSRAVDAGVFLVRSTLPDGTDAVYALGASCTYLGCSMTWDSAETRFVCPCHGCTYDILGKPVAGPGAEPMDRLAVSLSSDGSVRVDRGRVVAGDSARPPSAIPVP